MQKINRETGIVLSAVTLVGVLFYGGGLYFKRQTKWGKLTSPGILPKAIMYCLLLNTTNYFLLVRTS